MVRLHGFGICGEGERGKREGNMHRGTFFT